MQLNLILKLSKEVLKISWRKIHTMKKNSGLVPNKKFWKIDPQNLGIPILGNLKLGHKRRKKKLALLSLLKRFQKISHFTSKIKWDYGCLSSSSCVFCHPPSYFNWLVRPGVPDWYKYKLAILGLFYMIYFQDERHEFNCELEWDANLLIRPLVLCNMQGNSFH